MADKNLNSDKDNAYIENLLSQLRRTLNETTSTQSVDSTSSDNQSLESSAEEETVCGVCAEDTEPDDSVEKEESVSIPAADTDCEALPAAVTADTATDETVIVETALANGESIGEDTGISADTASEIVSDNAPENSGQVLQDEVRQEAELPKHEYARTVLPTSDKGSPIGRHRELRVPNIGLQLQERAETSEINSLEIAEKDTSANGCEDANTEMFSDAVEPTEEGTTPFSDEVITAADNAVTVSESDAFDSELAPVPDAIQPESADIAVTEHKGAEAEKSVWDTLPPLSSFSSAFRKTEQPPTVTPLDADTDTGSLDSKDEDRFSVDDEVEGIERKREKYTRVRDNIFNEPIESMGGEHADAQMDAWKSELCHTLTNLRVRSIFAGVVTFLLFLMEIIPGLRESLLSHLLFTRIPGVTQLIDLQLLLLVCFVGYPPLFRAVGALFDKRIIPETLALLSAVLSVTANVIFYLSGSPSQYLTGLVGAVPVLVALLADYCRISSASYAFRAYAAKGHKTVGQLSAVADNNLLTGAFSDSEASVVMMETQPSERVDGYIASARYRTEHRLFSVVSVVIAAASALVYMIYLIAKHTAYDAVIWNTVTVMCGCLPLSAFALHRFFFAMLSTRVAKERVGVTGEDAIYRYADARVMTFEDTEAFPAGSVQVNGIKLCGDFQLDKALYLMASIFDVVGGPLNSVFRISTANMKISDNVTIRSIRDNGIEAKVNGEEVYVGNRAFLESLGVKVFRDGEDGKAEQENSNVLYVAYHARLAVKFYIGYEISTAFEGNIEYYAKHGFTSVILTADPLLNEKLIDRVSYISEYDVRIVKKDATAVTAEQIVPRTAPLITYGPRKTLRRMPFFFMSYKKAQRAATIIAFVLASVVALALPVLTTSLNFTTPLAAFALQLATLLPTVGIALTLLYLNPNK